MVDNRQNMPDIFRERFPNNIHKLKKDLDFNFSYESDRIQNPMQKNNFSALMPLTTMKGNDNEDDPFDCLTEFGQIVKLNLSFTW